MTDSSHNGITTSEPPSRWWVLFPVGLALLCVALTLVAYHYRDKYHDLADKYRSLSFRNVGLENDCRRYRDLLADFERPPLQVEPTMTTLELTNLRKKGLEDPYAALADDLVSNPHFENQSHPDLDFTEAEQVCVLGPDRAMARYEGLDESGTALLAFRVDDHGSITWRLLERIDEP